MKVCFGLFAWVGLLSSAAAVSVSIDASQRDCYYEFAHAGERLVGSYEVSAGGFLDITLDFLFYAAIPLGFIFADPELNGIAGSILLATFIGTGSSFLAFAIAAEKFKIDKPQFKYKSF